MVDGVIRKITSALPAARPQPQIIRGTIDGSRRGRTNVFTPCNQSESMEPSRTRKQISISVPRSSRKRARPMTTSPDDFSIFFIFLPIPKNRGEKQTKSKNRILTMALCKTLFSNSLEKEKRYNIFPFLFPEICYSDDSYLRFFSEHSWMEIELKIWMYHVSAVTRFTRRNYGIFDRIDASKRFLSMAERTNGSLIFEASKRGVASGKTDTS